MTFYGFLLFIALFGIGFALPWDSSPSNESDLASQRISASDRLSLNMQQLADLAMGPALNSQNLLELYQESVEIINNTQADSVLMSLEPVSNQSADADPIMVMAVYNPAVPSNQDLLDRFRLYFVNLTESLPVSRHIDTTLSDLLNSPTSTSSMWNIMRNFIKNQANAIVGAFWTPFNVGAKAMMQSTNEHAEHVLSGSTIGSAMSKPVIMTAVDFPNDIEQRIVTFSESKATDIETTGQRMKLGSGQAIDFVANSLANGANTSSDLAVQYLARPIGAFTGFNMNMAGSALAHIGQGVNNTGIQLSLLGQQLEKGAITAINAGATAIAWGLDDAVQLPGEVSAESRRHA